MDIFTTQLTRVVPVIIQPEKLKVKALLKGEPLGELKDDMKELTPSDYAFYHNASQKQQEQQSSSNQYTKNTDVTDEEKTQEEQEEKEQIAPHIIETTQAYDKKMLLDNKNLSDKEPSDPTKKEKLKHFDIFV